MDANSRNTDSSHHHDRTHRTQETPTPASGQAPLHAQGGRETSPARGASRSTPDPVHGSFTTPRIGRSQESVVEIDRDAFYDCFGIYPDDLRRSFATALNEFWESLRPVELHPRRRG
jgi:hypothetical protein